MQAYPLALRERVLSDCDAGLQTKAVAEKYRVSRTWVRSLKQRRRETGEIAPRRGGGGRKRKFDRARLAELVAADADATLAELRERLGVKCALSAIWTALDQLHITFKKKTLQAAEQDRPDVAERRAAWRVTQLGLDPARLVFVDETWSKTNMTRLRGRALRGTRVVEPVPHGHWKTTTLIAALDGHGIRCGLTLDGAVEGAAFESFVGQVLAPSLRPGDLVILDNLSSHKGPRVGELIRTVHADVLYRPPYSPDFNPIENAFSKIKQALRSLGLRIMSALWSTMQSVLDRITPSDAAGFFRHCGYATDQK